METFEKLFERFLRKLVRRRRANIVGEIRSIEAGGKPSKADCWLMADG
ncbi:MAG TPA: hypothetical protein VNY05_05015 [Candidatus Acidoferrales bacterium]|jgi:hypothetical protein|nr:hypothetical protein [Candidatus Acidoferrales bacterium]